MRPAFLYLLAFLAIATAFVAFAPIGTRPTAGIPAESLARYHASALTSRITFTSEAVPNASARLEAVANLQQPAHEELFHSGRAIASAAAFETDGTH
jgi:hypothetical protein